ncbi:MAG: DUF2520 domain-containing protein [Chitinophagaceae bacterium]|nr:DUF2520 domain-containing protein [Chitinophagaceae bacterium]
MKVVIIGSGNVASVLGRLFVKNGHQVIQVVSRNVAHARILGEALNCAYTNEMAEIDQHASLYVLAVSDIVLYNLKGHIHFENKLVLHTAGSVPNDVLKEVSANYGVLYPMQSLRKEMEYPQEIPFLIDGNTEETIREIEDFAKTLSSSVTRANDTERLKLHVAAVIVSNFTNHLYALAASFCEKEKIDFKLLFPLIKETAERIDRISPVDAQTGPAVRNDLFTLDKHIRLLADYPQLKNIYLKITESIVKGVDPILPEK